MSVTEVKQALGSWSLALRDGTPADVLDAVTPFGHIAIIPGRLTEGDIQAAGDALLSAARYVGVYRSRDAGGESGRTTLNGSGMAFWLGDEDDKGYVYESTLTASGTFSAVVTQLLAPVLSVATGTLSAVPGDAGTFTSPFIYQSPRAALTYVTDTFSSSTVPVGWRVNGNGTVDAGPESALYVTSPTAMLVAKDEDAGRDMAIIGMRGNLELESDLTDYTTRVVLLAQGEEAATATGSATLPSTPYKDIRGNSVKFTRLVSEDQTSGSNATARAQLQLNRFSATRYAVTLDTSQYDVKGDFAVGDNILLFDPANGFLDLAREEVYRGLVINPLAAQCTEMTWPVPAGWTVAYRDGLGVWTDLSAHYVPESGATTVVIGRFSRDILANSYQQVGSRPIPDSSVPAAPTITASATTAYLSALSGTSDTKAVIQLTWSVPLNTDASTVVDGDHYVVRYRPVTTSPYPATHLQMASKLHSQLLAHQQPLIPAITDTTWHNVFVPWGTNTVGVNELTPGVRYEFQVAAVDSATPPNSSAFSSSWTIPAALDNLAPSQPAAPEVAGSNIAIQVTHRLGLNAGGTFNLEADLDHLEVHVSGDPAFAPDDSTRVGKLVANVALMRAGIPVVGTFPIQQVDAVQVKVVAVDRTGNRSQASPAAGVSVVLIDTAHISDLTASKITAGTVTSTWIQAGEFVTATAGARAGFNSTGFFTYRSDGVLAFSADTSGNVNMIGTMTTASNGRRIQVNPAGGEGQIRFYNSDNGDYALIDTGSYYGGSESSIKIRSSLDANNNLYGTLYAYDHLRMGYMQSNYTASGALVYLDPGQGYFGMFPGDSFTSGLAVQSNLAYLGLWGGLNVLKGGFQVFDSGGNTVTQMVANDDAGSTNQAAVFVTEAGRIGFLGSFSNNWTFSAGSTDAVIAGQSTSTISATTTVTSTYGPTMASRPAVCYGYQAAANSDHRISSFTTTSWVLTTAVSQACNLSYWAFRTTGV